MAKPQSPTKLFNPRQQKPVSPNRQDPTLIRTAGLGQTAAQKRKANRNSRLRKRRASQDRKLGRTTRAVKRARGTLRHFRHGTVVALAITSFILLLFGPGEVTVAQQTTDTVTAVITVKTDDSLLTDSAGAVSNPAAAALPDSVAEEEVSAREATGEAVNTLRGIWKGVYRNLPKVGIALIILMISWVVVRGLTIFIRRYIGHWQKSAAMAAVASILVWLLAAGIVVSVVAGDIRALVGSLGLVGLALSWSLQTPIESFTGWLLNSFQGYYRVGDRISVGEVFGDVFRIDFLTTTVWEIGAPYKPGYVLAEQPTGRLVTFPNSEVLAGTIVNLTRDFSFVWDEIDVAVANESDLRLAIKVLERISTELLGDYMVAPARAYEKILQQAGLESSIDNKPQVFLSSTDSWTNLTVRYLVGARERRKWKSELLLCITEELNKPEYIGKVLPAYSRQQIQFLHPDGTTASPQDFADDETEEQTNPRNQT